MVDEILHGPSLLERRILAIATAGFLALGVATLAACGGNQRQSDTADDVDEAVEDTGEAIDEAGEDTGEAIDEATEK